MDENQKINCTVESCTHNDNEKQECELQAITVEPGAEEGTGEPEDESMCGDYEPVEEAGEEETETPSEEEPVEGIQEEQEGE